MCASEVLTGRGMSLSHNRTCLFHNQIVVENFRHRIERNGRLLSWLEELDWIPVGIFDLDLSFPRDQPSS